MTQDEDVHHPLIEDAHGIGHHAGQHARSPNLSEAMERCNSAMIEAMIRAESPGEHPPETAGDELCECVRSFASLLRQAGARQDDAIGIVTRLADGAGMQSPYVAELSALIVRCAKDAYRF